MKTELLMNSTLEYTCNTVSPSVLVILAIKMLLSRVAKWKKKAEFYCEI